MELHRCMLSFKNYHFFGNGKKISVYNLILGKSKSIITYEEALNIELNAL